jgi:hypothetical protein|tara:strand:+ start:392 stop:1003 length:612 start_codon:yes stop_codon:yes gene_type:complete
MKNFNLIIPLIFFISSCSYDASFRQDFVPMTPSIATSQKLDGKGLIVMSAYDENLIYSDNPSSFTGGGTKLTLPIGQIVKRISLEVFGSIFAKGAYFDNQPSNSEDYILVIKPDVKVDNYKYDQLENLGFAVTPKVSISANIQVLSSDRSIIFDKNYSYVDKKARAYLFAGSPDEKINELIHQSIHQILLESLTDIRKNLIEN